MAYDEHLAKRMTEILKDYPGYSEKKMFGGICYLIHGNMLAGVTDEALMLRVGQELYEEALEKKGAYEMDFTGRPMRGMIYVKSESVKTKASLTKWLNFAYDFVKTLPKKKKKVKT